MSYDLILRNGTVIDGTRAPRFAADIAIEGDQIARIGDLAGIEGRREIDATGKIVAPGFIDAHTHDDRLMLSDSAMAPKVSQGVTTVVAGNCGVSLAPVKFPNGSPTPPLSLLDGVGEWFKFDRFKDYVKALRKTPAATNAALLVGHTTMRCATMSELDRPATSSEIAAMRSILSEALEAGAIGASTGLYYEPAMAAPTEEVIEVCRPLTAAAGLYCTHMRDESEGILDSLNETFRIGRELGVSVVISHHKLAGVPSHGRSRETLPFIGARRQTQSICLDCYPYAASSTILSMSRVKVASKVLVSSSLSLPQYAGMELAEIAREMGVTEEEAVAKLLPASAIYFSMDEADVQRILSFEHTMIGSDGLPHETMPHPRLWGTFPRVLGHYSRNLGLFPLETAVYKMTGLTAKNFGLARRGELHEGHFADITVFDANEVDEAATFAAPIAPAKGIDCVIVNGKVVWQEGKSTKARPGRVVSRVAR